MFHFPLVLDNFTPIINITLQCSQLDSISRNGGLTDSNPNVTLEEDLSRRDLTINAIAEDHLGQIIDPFNGQQDLSNRVLRHVSNAFVEDPLRVLRVSRFKAKLHGLNFEIASETKRLLKEIVESGELIHLVPE